MKQFWKILLLLSLLGLAACGGQTTATPTSPAAISTQSATSVATAAATVSPTATTASTATLAATTQSGTTQTPAAVNDCTAPAALTPAVTEGPYFKAGSPESATIIGSQTGTKLTLTGYVLTADCKPVAHALLDFWQANAQGQYDNSGYTLRGHQYSDASGHFQLVTVVPGLYPGRTEHIHVKVQAPNGPILTTQLFFPNVNQNQSDSIYDPNLLIKIQSASASSVTASFNFIIAKQ